MGLGKTIQVATFISALIDMGEAKVSKNLSAQNCGSMGLYPYYRSKIVEVLLFILRIQTFMIVVPTSLLPNWEKELGIWVPNTDIYKYTGELTKRQRERQLAQAQRVTSVMLASYG